MNRLIIIGNGFDRAHDLKTSYENFINWYWDYVRDTLIMCTERTYVDPLMSIALKETVIDSNWMYLIQSNSSFIYKDKFRSTKYSGKDVMDTLQKAEDVVVEKSLFYSAICKCIETKGWVDIENEYYNLLKKYSKNPDSCNYTAVELNNQLLYLQDKLMEYLSSIKIDKSIRKDSILQKIYSPIELNDVSIEGRNHLINYVDDFLKHDPLNAINAKRERYSKRNTFLCSSDIENLQNAFSEDPEYLLKALHDGIYHPILLPDNIMLLSFNYTNTAELYLMNDDHFSINFIHGKLDEKESIIFGYGDELDEEYKQLQNQNINEYLKNIKSIKYLERDNYRKVLSFIESGPYQVCIMGHSCGNSDRTLLNTLFEHKNCISVKPYYYINEKNENKYLEMVQNISRNFTDMKLMRDRVVNKTYCETL